MKSWQGMERNADSTAETGDGCVYAQNVRFYVEGELQRRRGLVKVAAGTRPLRIAQFWSPATGMRTLILNTSGNITEAVST